MGAPIRKLPLKMTVEIFFHILHTYPIRSTLVGIQSPTVLSQVCRAWRNIAISLPRLALTAEASPTSRNHGFSTIQFKIEALRFPCTLTTPHVQSWQEQTIGGSDSSFTAGRTDLAGSMRCRRLHRPCRFEVSWIIAFGVWEFRILRRFIVIP